MDYTDPLSGMDYTDTLSGLDHINPSLDQDVDATLSKTSTSKGKAYWDYELSIVLINKYKVHYPLFADDIHKNVEVKIRLKFSFCTCDLLSLKILGLGYDCGRVSKGRIFIHSNSV